MRIVNAQGLHARPAAEFVRWARRFRADIKVVSRGAAYSGESIMELLGANLGCGERVTLQADGEDEHAALERLSALLEEFRVREQEQGEGEEGGEPRRPSLRPELGGISGPLATAKRLQERGPYRGA